jgi:hypothetical protein
MEAVHITQATYYTMVETEKTAEHAHCYTALDCFHSRNK